KRAANKIRGEKSRSRRILCPGSLVYVSKDAYNEGDGGVRDEGNKSGDREDTRRTRPLLPVAHGFPLGSGGLVAGGMAEGSRIGSGACPCESGSVLAAHRAQCVDR